ncbi:MAG: hypothetical protein ACI9FU_001221, partial [Granulosicoccus sp.]
MKTFSRIIGSVSLVIVAFFLIGVFVNRISYNIELTLDRPAHQVFNSITNRKLQKQWVNGLQSSELIKGPDKAEGAIYAVRVLDGSRTIQIIEQIERLEPDSLLEYAIETNGIEGRVIIQLINQEKTSLLRITTELEGTVWFMKSLLPLLKHTLYERDLRDY